MLDFTFGHLSTSDKINLFNAAGAWLAAIGTLLAVFLAIYLARMDRKIKLRLSAGRRSISPGLSMMNSYECCSIRAVNTGFRKVTITGVGWRVGLFNKTVYEQMLTFPPSPSTMPITLADGEEACWHIPFLSLDGHPNWIDDFPRKLPVKYPYITRKTLRVFVYTSVGKPFKGKLEKTLLDILIKAAQEQASR